MGARFDAPVRGFLRELAPEPARFWIRYAPRQWPGPAVAWVDLAAGALADAGTHAGGRTAEGAAAALDALLERPLDDVLYLPPVPPELAAARDRLAARHARRGTPVLVHLLPGDASPAVGEAVTAVLDLTPVALGAAAFAAGDLPAAGVAAAAWPLLPGAEPLAAQGALLAALAERGVGALQAVPLEVEPRRLRELAAGLPEARYLKLFHGAVPDAGEAARAALGAGLAALLARPLPRPPLRGAGNLRLAGALAAEGELCLRLGGPEPRAQSLLRAARFAERAREDLEALARDGNLGVVPWLDAEGRRVVAAALSAPAP